MAVGSGTWCGCGNDASVFGEAGGRIGGGRRGKLSLSVSLYGGAAKSAGLAGSGGGNRSCGRGGGCGGGSRSAFARRREILRGQDEFASGFAATAGRRARARIFRISAAS